MARAESELVFLGCYTPQGGGRGEGVVLARRDPVGGGLTVVGTAAVTESPSYLARHPRLPVLYAVNERRDGAVSAWRFDTDGALTPLAVRGTGGEEPCHLAVSPDGGHLFVANYGSGSVAVHPLDDQGVPGERSDVLRHAGHGADPDRQAGPHAHQVCPGADSASLLVVDLGIDLVGRYRLDRATGRLTATGEPLRLPAGTGPRHLARHPDGRRAYVAGELDGTVTEIVFGADGGLRTGARVPASDRGGHVQPSGIAVGADGRFLYLANRGVGTVTVFDLTDVDPRHLDEVETGGEWPRQFAFAGSHLYVADERAHQIRVFALDPSTGVPRPCGEPVEVPSPTCVLPV